MHSTQTLTYSQGRGEGFYGAYFLGRQNALLNEVAGIHLRIAYANSQPMVSCCLVHAPDMQSAQALRCSQRVS